MQAKDISTESLLEAIEADAVQGVPCLFRIADILGAPFKVVLAKARRLERRGVIDACTCGCIGVVYDWEGKS